MRKNMMKLMLVIPMVLMLSACGNNNSKVDQVVQEQMQEADGTEKEKDTTTEITSDTSIAQEETDEESAYVSEPDASVDVDLTALSSTMVYSEVYNMLTVPDDYIGKTVKMSGMFVAYTNQDESQYYPAVIIADATACCSQGLEFVLEGNPSYPEGYPKLETEITVIGTFETYDEDGNTYCRLQNAKSY